MISGNRSTASRSAPAGTGNRVVGNYIGTTGTGTAALGNGGVGVNILGGGNTIGGTTANERNVISGNSAGVQISTSTGLGNVVQGNYIGTDRTGPWTSATPTMASLIAGGARNNIIGGTAAGAGNLISGNNGNGVEITGNGTTDNVVQGNFIGTNAAGSAALANTVGRRSGSRARPTATRSAGASSARATSSPATLEDGIALDGVIDTLIQGNYIGLSATGGCLDRQRQSAGRASGSSTPTATRSAAPEATSATSSPETA